MSIRRKRLTAHGDMSRDLKVRLERISQEPATSVERLTVEMLRRQGPMDFHLLVERVATGLYQQELSDGAWVLDLAVIGTNLFVSSVAKEIQAGNGILWRIEHS